MDFTSQFRHLKQGQTTLGQESQSDEKDSLFLSPVAQGKESSEEIKSPVRTFKRLDFFTVTYNHPAQDDDPDNQLFPFGSQSQPQPQSQRKTTPSRSTSHSKKESNLKRRILTILDEPRSDLFSEYCDRNSIKGFLKSQQAMSKDIYFEVLEDEKLDKSIMKGAERLIGKEMSQFIETPGEDDRISHSFSIAQARNSARDTKDKPEVTFESWLARNKPK